MKTIFLTKKDDYFNGYRLDISHYLLEDEDLKLINACIWMVDNRSTIRETAKNNEFSTTTLWRRIHNKLPSLSSELHNSVIKRLKLNLLKRGRRK